MAKLEGWVAKLEGWDDKLEGWVDKFEGWIDNLEGWVAELEGWVAEVRGWMLVTCLPVHTKLSGFESSHPSKIIKGRHKQRSGQKNKK
jgi:hypothetical protein